ncbi:MAG: TetR/AcrR family transcriptional regulator [Sneathiellaceae bacterium]
MNRHPAFDRDGQYRNRRSAIVETAVHLFNRSGFHATSVEEIATAVGISKATLYYYFRDKPELLYQCYLYALDSGRDAAEQAASAGGTGLQRLEAYIRVQFSTLAANDGATWILSDLSVLSEAQRAEVKQRSRAVDHMLQGFIRDGMADGSIAARDPKIAEFFLIGAMNWLPRWYRPGGRYSSAELAEIFLGLTLDGLRAR